MKTLTHKIAYNNIYYCLRNSFIPTISIPHIQRKQLLYKEEWDGDLKVIDIGGTRKTKEVINFSFTGKYNKELPICNRKLHDLQNLCKKNVIPRGSQSFFFNLQGGKKRNCLDEPDVAEEEKEDE